MNTSPLDRRSHPSALHVLNARLAGHFAHAICWAGGVVAGGVGGLAGLAGVDVE